MFIAGKAAYPADIPVDFYFQSEYRKDSIDYNEITKYYYREKTGILFSQDTLFNFTYIYLDNEQIKKYTWNLILNDISDNLSFLTGNFFADFGTGLLTGSKRFYNADIFTYRAENAGPNVFTPCSSGNPAFAFNGLAAAYRMDFPDILVTINAFYSVRECFIDEDSYESKTYQGSIESIEVKYSKDYRTNEPVNTHTHGSMFSAQIMKSIKVQTYCLFTGIETAGGTRKKIIWDYSDSGDIRGTMGLSGYGLCAMYRDDYLSLILDSCLTIRETITQDSKKKDIKGCGFLYGLKFKPPFIELSITGKDVDSEYYSPYSSSIGEDYPEKACFIESAIIPFKNFRLGSSVSSQKKTSPGLTDIEAPLAHREAVYAMYSYGSLKNIEVSIRKVNRINNGITENKNQIRESTDLKISGKINAEFSGIIQDGNKVEKSWIINTGIDILFFSYFNMNINYIKAYISEENAVYTVISPIRYSSSPGFLINENSNTIISRLNFKYERIFFSLRYLYQFTDSKYLYSSFEFSGSGYF